MEKREKVSQFHRIYKILEHLQYYSDSTHPLTQADLRKVESLKPYIMDKGNFTDNMYRLYETLNIKEDGSLKDIDDWRIVFDGLLKEYEDDDEIKRRVGKMYYNPVFSYDDIDDIIESILFSKTLSTEKANSLISKVEDNLINVHYKKGPKNICTIQELELRNKDHIRSNLHVIQSAIESQSKIEFIFNGYNYKKELVPTTNYKYQLSPYYIVASSGKYYLLGCREMYKNNDLISKMSIYRIDLMTNLEIAINKETKKNIPALRKTKVLNLPQEWDDQFLQTHMNMAYDNPIRITLKIKNVIDEKGIKRPGYTFLYDQFGDNFTYIEADSENQNYDIVTTICSPYAMVSWALQYSDRVEVLEPIDVRNEVINKIKDLQLKYKL